MAVGDFLIGLLVGYLIWGTRHPKETKKQTMKEWWHDQKAYEKVLIILVCLVALFEIVWVGNNIVQFFLNN